MRYASIRKMDISNGEGVGVALFTQGCPIHCKGCFQPETWDFNGGELLTGAQESLIYKLLKKPYISKFSVLGGEPLIDQNLEDLNRILCTVKSNFPHIKVWIWTGYTWDELQERRKEMFPDYLFLTFKYTDYLIAGPYIDSERDLTLLWCGSRNQEVIDMQATREQGEKVLYVQ